MDRLLVLLFSVTLLLATSPPRALLEGCDYSGGVCTTQKEVNKESSCWLFPANEEEGSSEGSGCSFPICCVYGPCCCLCIVPVCPVIHVAPPLPEEENARPTGGQDFAPQQVYRAIWKPPATVV